MEENNKKRKHKKYWKRYYDAHREERIEEAKKYYAEHREEVRKKYEDNREERLEYQREYERKNRERRTEYKRKYRAMKKAEENPVCDVFGEGGDECQPSETEENK